MATKNPFRELKKKLINQKKAILRSVGNEAVEFFTSRITSQTDVKGQSFKSRKYSTQDRKGRGILTKSGALRRSIRVVSISNDKVKISAKGVPYAYIHNFGGRIPITPKMRKFFWAKYYEAGKTTPDAEFWRNMALKRGALEIPKRQFMGDSELLEKLVKDTIKRGLKLK